MFKKLSLSAALVMGMATSGFAAGGAAHVHDYDFSFEGPFGTYDQMQLQRGLQVYTEICASCHGLKFLSFRNLGDNGGPELPEDQVFAYAEFYEVWDPTLSDGDGDFRPATPTDKFPEGALSNAPDLTLMAKARAGFHGPMGTGISQLVNGMGGAEYIASLLAGYEDAPSCAPDDFDGSYNAVFTAGGYPEECKDEDGNHKYPGSWISMSQPLYGDDVEYADGASTELEDIAQDVSAFLMWTAEPKLIARKQAGLAGFIFLSLLSVLLYLTNKRLWAPVKKKAKAAAAE